MKHLIYLSFIFLFISTSCTEEILSPVQELVGSRDYFWTMDTIPDYLGFKIWGRSLTDLRLLSTSPYSHEPCIFQYKNNGWTKEIVPYNFTPSAIYGVNNNIWAWSLDGSFWKYNGSWKKKFSLLNTFIADIRGSEDNIYYAVGSENNSGYLTGIILRLNDSGCQKVNIPSTPYHFSKIRKDNYSGCFYILAEGEDQSAFFRNIVFKFDGKELIKIYDEAWSVFTRIDFSELNGNVFFCIGNRVEKYLQNSFVTAAEIKHPNFTGKISGWGEKDLLLIMFDGIAHYNGTDIKYVYKHDKYLDIFDFICFDKEVVLLSSNIYTTLLKGKLI